MISVGLITYHAAYNFGSMLQAYATQSVIQKLGYKCEIINYRPLQQQHYYNDLINVHSGLKPFIRSVFLLKNYKSRNVRALRYEQFMKEYLSLSEHMYSVPSQLSEISSYYDIFVSGSDQIINKHSNELESEDWSAMSPYLLSFTDKPKISYASSPANMTDFELMKIADELKKFKYISCREVASAKKLSELLGIEVTNVLDPTLLLDKEYWNNFIKNKKMTLPDNYIVYYSLIGPKPMRKVSAQLAEISRSTNLPVVMITPFAPVTNEDWSIDASSFGPIEFLYAISHASSVITNSYHGTLFALNFGVPFWSISQGKGADLRKDQILHALKLDSRIVANLSEISVESLMSPKLDLSYTLFLRQLREFSVAYLKKALANSI